MIEFKEVSKVYNKGKKNEKLALDKVSFSLPDNGMVFITGKSGSGKSTLLNILGCLDTHTSGDIEVNGKNISKLKGKNLTAYRNTYIGFIFQDFNLLEDLNVYENVSLAYDLKQEKYTKDDILNTLKALGIEELYNRKVSEISGGEKQRVAIARAIVKKPKILLCDEPTGNLDSLNSEQIFKILKSISKDTLVIVVTHDWESALKYGYGVITLGDGKVTKNNLIKTKNKNEEMSFKNFHLSILKKLKLSYLNLKNKKTRLVITTMLCTIAFTCFGLANTLNDFDEYKIHADTMINENNDLLYLSRKTQNYNINEIGSRYLDLINSNIDSKIVKISTLDGFYLPLPVSIKEEYKNSAFYNISLSNGTYDTVEIYRDEDIKDIDIIGEYPSNSTDVLISEIYAEKLLSGEFKVSKDAKNDEEKYTLKTVNKKEELCGLKLYINDLLSITISGIVKDDSLLKYESLKKADYENMSVKPSKLYKEYNDKYDYSNKSHIIISERFIKENHFSDKKIYFDGMLIKTISTVDDHLAYNLVLGYLDGQVKVYDSKNTTEIRKVNRGEMYLSMGSLDSILKGELNKTWQEEAKKRVDKYKKDLSDYEAKMELYNNMLLEDPSFIVPTLKEPVKPDIDKIYNDIAKRLYNREELQDKILTIEIVDETKSIGEQKTQKYDVKIKGLIVDYRDNILYSSVSTVGEEFYKYLEPKEIVRRIDIHESDREKLMNIFKNFSHHEILVLKTDYSDTIVSATKIANKSINILKIASYVFLGFSIVLLCTFIYSSINANKKRIGVLRALGSRTKDCIDIFILENALIGLFTFIISSILILIITNLINLYISSNVGFYLWMFKCDYSVFIYTLITVIISIIFSSILPIVRLSKMKPIDVINKN